MPPPPPWVPPGTQKRKEVLPHDGLAEAAGFEPAVVLGQSQLPVPTRLHFIATISPGHPQILSCGLRCRPLQRVAPLSRILCPTALSPRSIYLSALPRDHPRCRLSFAPLPVRLLSARGAMRSSIRSSSVPSSLPVCLQAVRQPRLQPAVRDALPVPALLCALLSQAVRPLLMQHVSPLAVSLGVSVCLPWFRPLALFGFIP